MKRIKSILLGILTLGLIAVGSCKKEDANTNSPCKNIVCLNDGYCANGQCVCPEGYSGANCSLQITPDFIRINKIEVIQFPPTDGGAGWDLTSGADIYPILYLGNTEIWNSSSYFENANPNSDYEFIPNPAIELKSPNSQYIIRLYDHDDFDADDYMGGIQFTPYNSANKFPKVLILDAGGGVAFKLYVSYSW